MENVLLFLNATLAKRRMVMMMKLAIARERERIITFSISQRTLILNVNINVSSVCLILLECNAGIRFNYINVLWLMIFILYTFLHRQLHSHVQRTVAMATDFIRKVSFNICARMIVSIAMRYVISGVIDFDYLWANCGNLLPPTLWIMTKFDENVYGIDPNVNVA